MFLHAEVPSQLHLIRVMISSGANVTPSGTVVGSNVLEGSCLTYPYSTGSGAGGSRDSAAFPSARLKVGPLHVLYKSFCSRRQCLYLRG